MSLLEKEAVDVEIGIKDDDLFGTQLIGANLKKPLLSILISPFLKKMAAAKHDSHRFSLQMLAHVHVEQGEISLNHSTGMSVYSSAGDVLNSAGGSGVRVILTLHGDEEAAKPRFLARLMSGLHLHASSAAFKVFLGDVGLQTELNRKWLAKPAVESLVAPFLDCYNAKGLPGPPISVVDVAGLTVEGVVAPTGREALQAAPRDFAVAGGTTYVHITLKDGSAPPTGSHTRVRIVGEDGELVGVDDIMFTRL